MNTPQDCVGFAIEGARKLVDRFCADLTAHEYLHRPCNKGNCVAWTLGHLILSARACITQLGGTNLPALPEGFEARFGRDDACAGAAEFGDATALLPLFNQHHHLFVDAVRKVPAEKFNQTLDKPHPMFRTVGEKMAFMAVHIGMHAGQFTVVRRSLGRPPLM